MPTENRDPDASERVVAACRDLRSAAVDKNGTWVVPDRHLRRLFLELDRLDDPPNRERRK